MSIERHTLTKAKRLETQARRLGVVAVDSDHRAGRALGLAVERVEPRHSRHAKRMVKGDYAALTLRKTLITFRSGTRCEHLKGVNMNHDLCTRPRQSLSDTAASPLVPPPLFLPVIPPPHASGDL